MKTKTERLKTKIRKLCRSPDGTPEIRDAERFLKALKVVSPDCYIGGDVEDELGVTIDGSFNLIEVFRIWRQPAGR